MMEKRLVLSNYKPLGISVLVLSALTIFQSFIPTYSYSQYSRTGSETLGTVIFYLGAICFGISLLLKNDKWHIFNAISLWVLSVSALITYKITAFSVIGFVMLAILGIVAITQYKKANVGLIVGLITIGTGLLSNYIISPLVHLSIIRGNYTAYYGFGAAVTTLLGLLIQLSFVIVCLTKCDKKAKQTKQNNVVINPAVIDFKTLLSFIENQYKSGEISEEEYNQKRSEILKQL